VSGEPVEVLGRLKRFAWRGEGSSVLQYNREQRGSSADGRLQCAPESFMAVLVLQGTWLQSLGVAAQAMGAHCSVQ